MKKLLILPLALFLYGCSTLTAQPKDVGVKVKQYSQLATDLAFATCSVYVQKALKDNEVMALQKTLEYTQGLLTTGVNARRLTLDLQSVHKDIAPYAPFLAVAISLAQTEIPEEYKTMFIYTFITEIISSCRKGLGTDV
jgi:hypothetical protein